MNIDAAKKNTIEKYKGRYDKICLNCFYEPDWDNFYREEHSGFPVASYSIRFGGRCRRRNGEFMRCIVCDNNTLAGFNLWCDKWKQNDS